MITNQYVDLSGLPHKGKNNQFIDWKRSVGYNIPFIYDVIKGEIRIVGYEGGSQRKHRGSHLIITIDKYVPQPLRISTSVIRKGMLYNLVGDKIINVCPEILLYLVNPLDAYTFTYGSGKLVKMKCPICGFMRDRTPYVVYQYGFSCPMCGDGHSIPNKLMRNILTQLNIDFIQEVDKKHFAWIGKYKYDFYMCVNNENILIEMDGGYHKWQSVTDQIKTKLANDNNFKLIRIDCDYRGDPVAYIKKNILSSDLINILDLSNINWTQCKQTTIDSNVRASCLLWEEREYSTTEIATELGMERHTIVQYLRRGKSLGLCPSFSEQESVFRGNNDYLMLLKNEVTVGVFRHVHQLCDKSMELFGQKFHCSSVRACYDKTQTYKGFNIRRITKEEYEQYKMIKNIEVIKGGRNYDRCK